MGLLFILFLLQILLNTNGVPVKNLNDPACNSQVIKIQQVSFHQHGNYSGDYHSFCSNNPDIQSIPGHHQTARIFCVDRGVWIIDVSYNGIPSKSGILASGNLGRICLTFPPEFNTRFTGVRHLAAVDLSISVISLYKERYGGAEFRLDGQEVRLPEVIQISSFAMTGRESLTVYSGTNFDGQSACIVPGRNDPLLSGVTFSDVVPMSIVGSVRKGCTFNPSARISGVRSEESTGLTRIEGDPHILSVARIQIFTVSLNFI